MIICLRLEKIRRDCRHRALCVGSLAKHTGTQDSYRCVHLLLTVPMALIVEGSCLAPITMMASSFREETAALLREVIHLIVGCWMLDTLRLKRMPGSATSKPPSSCNPMGVTDVQGLDRGTSRLRWDGRWRQVINVEWRHLPLAIGSYRKENCKGGTWYIILLG